MVVWWWWVVGQRHLSERVGLRRAVERRRVGHHAREYARQLDGYVMLCYVVMVPLLPP
jgi:hypothetical protein